jgi:hypothetical protein
MASPKTWIGSMEHLEILIFKLIFQAFNLNVAIPWAGLLI